MIEAQMVGKLHTTPERRTGTTSGRPFVTCKARVPTSDADAVFVNVVCFSDTAGAALLGLEAGDAVALGGTLKPGAWIDRDGNPRPSVDMVVAQVMTSYGLAKKRKAAAAAQSPAPTGGQADAGRSDGLDDGDDEEWLKGGAR